jgi:hypothetical protein
MKKLIVIAILMGAATLAAAYGYTCPVHTYATCIDTWKLHPQNPDVHLFHCTCGDDVWINTR